MRSISKSQVPRALLAYQARPDAEYDGPHFTQVKNAIREQLLREQGRLCAYCMGRIELDSMKVEHWHCQTRYPDQALDYRNMLGVCMGNEGLEEKNHTCDTRKKDKNIQYNPADPAHNMESRIHYLGKGEIESNDAAFDRELNDVLNLNYSRLVENRKAVMGVVAQELGRSPGNRTRAEIKRFLDKWSTTDGEGRLPPYCGVAVYLLKKRLNRSHHF